MAYTTINKASDYFNTLLWTGNSGNQSITGNDFTADFTWSKTRSNAESHILMDTVRDAGTTLNQSISSNTSNAEGTLNNSSTLTVNSTGFDVAGTTGGPLNYTGYTYASWLWRAGGHTGTSNSDGTITSTVSANTTSGFSIVKYTGNGASGATVGHGLGSAPKMVIVKELNNASTDWYIYHAGIGATKFIRLNLTNATNTTAAAWNDTAPSSSVFTLGNGTDLNGSSENYIAYCFAEKTGFSKFGSYVGANSNQFIYLGFKPAMVIIKNASISENWSIYDNKRLGYNPAHNRLYPNLNNAEATETKIDFVSNGMMLRSAGDGHLTGGTNTFIYMAFAEAPLVGSNNVPCTAR